MNCNAGMAKKKKQKQGRDESKDMSESTGMHIGHSSLHCHCNDNLHAMTIYVRRMSDQYALLCFHSYTSSIPCSYPFFAIPTLQFTCINTLDQESACSCHTGDQKDIGEVGIHTTTHAHATACTYGMDMDCGMYAYFT